MTEVKAVSGTLRLQRFCGVEEFKIKKAEVRVDTDEISLKIDTYARALKTLEDTKDLRANPKSA